MKISFHGADRGVTGSCHLVECAGKKILVDCGLYQGGRELDEENAEAFGFDPAAIDYLLLTHAHLDHCGRIPLLVKRGFHGEIITTAATRELSRLVMLDSAHLQEEEARYVSRRKCRHGHNHNHHHNDEDTVAPLYTVLDALDSTEHFGRTAVYNKVMELAAGVRVTFYNAGHILGSASIFLELEENGQRRTILFSGDLGSSGRPLLRDPLAPSQVDVVVMETTYGDRLHKPFKDSVEEFYLAIDNAIDKGGNVIIPTFALERAQELLYYLREAKEVGRLSKSIQVFLDSPMAISATKIFERHPECYDADVAALFHDGKDPFYFKGEHFVCDTSESIALNNIKSGAVIMAGSGMCTGGRVRHHLRHNLWREESSVIFVGFAARGTLARKIIDGARQVRLFGEDIPVRATIHTINGFSAHADRDELLRWYGQFATPSQTYLVHGEREVMQAFARHLHGTQVEMPELHQEFQL